MRVKLTIEYDGTGFRGWARPARRAHRGGRVAAGARPALRPGSGGLAVAGRTDTGVHALANVVSVDVDGGPAAGARRRRAERVPAARSGGRLRRAGAGRLQRPLRRAVALLPLPRLAPPRALGARGDAARSGIRGRSTSPRCRRAAAQLVGQARLPRVHADRHAAHDLRADGRRARSGSRSTRTWSRSRSPPTRSCATWSAPWSARCSAVRTSPRSSKAAREPKRARRPHRTASTSSP